MTLKARRGRHDVRVMSLKILRLLLVLTAASPTSGCNSHMYYAEAKIFAAAVTEELVRLGVCADPHACQRAEIVLWQGGGWKIGPSRGGGVTINVYRVSDIAVANTLVERCRLLHAQMPNIPISIVIHSNPHIDNLHPGDQVVIKQEMF